MMKKVKKVTNKAARQTEKILLKDILFSPEKIIYLANLIKANYPNFQVHEFINTSSSACKSLELKARINCLAENLNKYIPENYESQLKILLSALPPPLDPNLCDNDFGDFIIAPFSHFVARYGCQIHYLNLSLEALYEITKRFSAEDAVRYFLVTFPEETLHTLQVWSRDDNYHVRRLCSEGTRPSLPWSQKINLPLNHSKVILDNLYSDTKRYVIRSVANHVNDIAKHDPQLAISYLHTWKLSNKQSKKEMDYLCTHGLRTLLKQGHAKALSLVGISKRLKFKLLEFTLQKQARLNNYVSFSITVQSKITATTLILYRVYFQHRLGGIKSQKVFRLKQLKIVKNTSVTISRKYKLNENATTRKIYKGKHALEILINGTSYGKKYFIVQ